MRAKLIFTCALVRHMHIYVYMYGVVISYILFNNNTPIPSMF